MRFPIALFVFLLFTGCKKDEEVAGGERIEIYKLEAYNLVQGKCQVAPNGIALDDNPVIANNDILEYIETTHAFRVTDAAKQRVSALRDGQPFAVTVDKTVIYYGIYKPSLSSSSCDHSITLGNDWSSPNRLRFNLGYPSGGGSGITDQRGDPLIIGTLKKQGKLR